MSIPRGGRRPAALPHSAIRSPLRDRDQAPVPELCPGGADEGAGQGLVRMGLGLPWPCGRFVPVVIPSQCYGCHRIARKNVRSTESASTIITLCIATCYTSLQTLLHISRLRMSVKVTFTDLAPKHLQRYVDEFSRRHNIRRLDEGPNLLYCSRGFRKTTLIY